MDVIVQKLVALGVPGLILLVIIGTTGLYGGAAIVAALSVFGGIWAGILAMGILALVADAIAKYGLDSIAKAVVENLLKSGLTQQQVIDIVYGSPWSWLLSNRIKKKCAEYIYPK